MEKNTIEQELDTINPQTYLQIELCVPDEPQSSKPKAKIMSAEVVFYYKPETVSSLIVLLLIKLINSQDIITLYKIPIAEFLFLIWFFT